MKREWELRERKKSEEGMGIERKEERRGGNGN